MPFKHDARTMAALALRVISHLMAAAISQAIVSDTSLPMYVGNNVLCVDEVILPIDIG